jgi:hypothetical protein
MKIFRPGDRTTYMRPSKLNEKTAEEIQLCCKETGEESRFVWAVFNGQTWPWKHNFERANVLKTWRQRRRIRKALYAAAQRTGGTVTR